MKKYYVKASEENMTFKQMPSIDSKLDELLNMFNFKRLPIEEEDDYYYLAIKGNDLILFDLDTYSVTVFKNGAPYVDEYLTIYGEFVYNHSEIEEDSYYLLRDIFEVLS